MSILPHRPHRIEMVFVFEERKNFEKFSNKRFFTKSAKSKTWNKNQRKALETQQRFHTTISNSKIVVKITIFNILPNKKLKKILFIVNILEKIIIDSAPLAQTKTFRRISSRDKFESRNYWRKFGRNLFNRSFFQKLWTKTSKNLDVWSHPPRKSNVNIKSIERWAGLNYRSKAAVSQQNSSFLCTHSYGKSLGLSTIPHIAYNQVFVPYSGFLDNRMNFVKTEN